MTALRCIGIAAFLVMSANARAQETVITIENFTFNPTEVTIKRGATVTWRNADDIPHSVVEVAAKFRSKALDTGETFSMTFANAGEIAYFCGLHPHMMGKIIIRP
jgi:plastocyanin